MGILSKSRALQHCIAEPAWAAKVSITLNVIVPWPGFSQVALLPSFGQESGNQIAVAGSFELLQGCGGFLPFQSSFNGLGVFEFHRESCFRRQLQSLQQILQFRECEVFNC